MCTEAVSWLIHDITINGVPMRGRIERTAKVNELKVAMRMIPKQFVLCSISVVITFHISRFKGERGGCKLNSAF